MAAPLVLTLHVVDELGATYAQAGIIAAASTIGAAVGAPWRGRLIDRMGLRRAIVPSCVAVVILYPLATIATYVWLIPLAFLMGLFLIPIFSIVRLSLSVLVEEDQRRTAFSADSVVAEASFIIGPAIGAVIVTTVGGGPALIAIGLCEGIAGIIFLWLNPPTKSTITLDVDPADDVKKWMSAPIGFLFLISAGATIALMATDLGIVAQLRELDEVSSVWIGYGMWGLASLVGGLVYGSLHTSIRPTYLLLALGLTTIPIGLASQVWSLGLWVIPAGLLCAPTITAAGEWIAKLVPERRRGEAMGWQGTAFTLGGATSAPLVGSAIDGVGAWGGFALGGIIASVIAVISLSGQLIPRWRPVPVETVEAVEVPAEDQTKKPSSTSSLTVDT